MKVVWSHAFFAGALALYSLGFFAGCGAREPNVVTAETDDPTYVQGKQLLKQGRTPEALAAFLKVIEKRGEQSAAESHLDAGIIYLKESKDPVEAYHHFRQYLSLQPNSKQAPYVRELIDNARREFARTLPAQSLENQSLRPDLEDQMLRLQRENDELRAQLEGFRGDAINRVPRPTRTSVSSALIGIHPVIPADNPGPIEPAPVETTSPVTAAPIALAAPGRASAPTGSSTSAASVRPPGNTPGARGGSLAVGRRHRVTQGDTLFSIAKKYYGSATAGRARGIFEANRDVMKTEGDLHPGMDLKIP